MGGKRFSKTFNPSSHEPFTLSRSKIDTFTDCRRCSYLDLRFGVKRPQGPSFTLNNAVDELLKREFDAHRANGTVHPLIKEYGIDLIPLKDERLEEWRDALKRGIRTHHAATNLIIRGGIDDVWQDTLGTLYVVDYKATAKKEGPKTADDLYPSYKKQVEIYQWLFRQNGFTVSPTAYFVYVNGKTDAQAFDARLEFDIELIAYDGSDVWVEPMLHELKAMLMGDALPPIGIAFGGGPCDYCTYREEAREASKVFLANQKHGKTKE